MTVETVKKAGDESIVQELCKIQLIKQQKQSKNNLLLCINTELDVDLKDVSFLDEIMDVI